MEKDNFISDSITKLFVKEPWQHRVCYTWFVKHALLAMYFLRVLVLAIYSTNHVLTNLIPITSLPAMGGANLVTRQQQVTLYGVEEAFLI